ncbi:MAG: DUF1826 domain-containing protein [Bacteroidia bacterium]|nr:DUF1826 domain-containing protein [Bacteroidia bacterium]
MKSITPSSHTTRDLLCNNWAEMTAIREPQHNIVHWPRPQDQRITEFLESLTKRESLPTLFRDSLLATQVENRLRDHLAPYSKGQEEGFERLCSDVGELASSFAGLASSPRLQTSFAFIQNDMCKLFHTDAIELRLLCTYIGQGTLWVPDQYVNWDNIREPSNEARVSDLSKVRQFAPSEIGILKGAMYDSNDGPAVLHRSPSIGEAGAIRVLLRLDSQLAW